MRILAETAVEFCAEFYLWSSISNEDFLKYVDLAFVIIILHRLQCRL